MRCSFFGFHVSGSTFLLLTFQRYFISEEHLLYLFIFEYSHFIRIYLLDHFLRGVLFIFGLKTAFFLFSAVSSWYCTYLKSFFLFPLWRGSHSISTTTKCLLPVSAILSQLTSTLVLALLCTFFCWPSLLITYVIFQRGHRLFTVFRSLPHSSHIFLGCISHQLICEVLLRSVFLSFSTWVPL